MSGVPRRAAEWGLLAAMAAIALGFALYTQHVWEDFYITYRAGKNLALGHGLLFNPGARVHSYTSPLGALLPALFSYVLGNQSDMTVIWLFRLVGIGLLVATGVVLVRTHERLGVARAATLLTLVFLGTETKIIDFSINGQEGAFLVFFACATWACVAREPISPLLLGAAWAGFQWSRPDDFIYGGSIALGMLLFGARGLAARGQMLRAMILAALVALLLYGPWLLWCWSYYGTPVPHTIIAKSVMAPDHGVWPLLKNLLLFPFDVLAGTSSTRMVFAPVYAEMGHGGWPALVIGVARLLGIVTALYWLFPFGGRQGRALSFAFLLSNFYLTHVIFPSPWYLPPVTTMGVMVLGFIADDVIRLRAFLESQGLPAAARRLSISGRVAAASVAVFIAAVLVLSSYQLRIQQYEIEERTRGRIGRWLKESSPTGRETVFVECLGYVGFFSGLKIYDYPGLSSPEVVAARNALQSDEWSRLIRRLNPDWLVLRTREAEDVRRQDAALLETQYKAVRQFDAAPRLAKYGWIPGRGYLEFDQTFVVFRRLESRADEASTMTRATSAVRDGS